MAKYCGKCKKYLKKTAAVIQCNGECTNYFHSGCARVVNLKKWSANDLKKWVCSNCKIQTASTSKSRTNDSVPVYRNSSETSNESALSLQLCEEIEQIKQRQKELEVLIETEKLRKENPENYFKDDLEESIDDLAIEHCRITEAAAVQDIVIPNLQLSDTLCKILSNSQTDEESMSSELLDLLTDDDLTNLNELLEEIAHLSSETLELRKEVASIEDEILQTHLKLQHVSAEKLFLMKTLQEIEEKKGKKKNRPEKEPSVQMENLRKEETKLTRMLNIKNNLLQKIVAFSGLNWAQNEELKNIVLDTGKPLDLQLSEIKAQTV